MAAQTHSGYFFFLEQIGIDCARFIDIEGKKITAPKGKTIGANDIEDYALKCCAIEKRDVHC